MEMNARIAMSMSCLLLAGALATASGCDKDTENAAAKALSSARAQDTVEALQAVAQKYPNSAASREAEGRLAILRAWDAARKANTIDAYCQFLRSNPKSDIAPRARAELFVASAGAIRLAPSGSSPAPTTAPVERATAAARMGKLPQGLSPEQQDAVLNALAA